MRIIHIGCMRHIGLAALALSAAGCASGPATVNVNVPPTSTVSSIVIVNTSNVTKPVELQANGNNLAYGTAGASVGAGVGMLAGNPAAGALIGAGGGVAVYQIKEALAPAAPASLQPNSLQSSAYSNTPAPAAAGAKGGDAHAGISTPGG